MEPLLAWVFWTLVTIDPNHSLLDGIAMIVDGVELHKNLNKTLTQKKAGCVPSVTALA